MSGYTKLFGSIVGSTIWREDDKTRLVWITMLALADSNGIVECSIPGLADFARVSLSECEAALAKLSAPDRYSRTPDHDGRRIADIDGGWLILNHDKYQQTNPTDRREYQRKWQKDYRERKRAGVDTALTGVDKSNDTETETYTETEKNKNIVADAPDYVVVHETKLDERTADSLADVKAVKNAKAFKAKLRPIDLPAWMPREVWDNFRSHRAANYKRHGPLTTAAERIALSKLSKLRDEGHDPIALVEEAIVRGWASIFPPKELQNGKYPQRKSAADERLERIQRTNREAADLLGLDVHGNHDQAGDVGTRKGLLGEGTE